MIWDMLEKAKKHRLMAEEIPAPFPVESVRMADMPGNGQKRFLLFLKV
jgi:hypothetical protein